MPPTQTMSTQPTPASAERLVGENRGARAGTGTNLMPGAARSTLRYLVFLTAILRCRFAASGVFGKVTLSTPLSKWASMRS